MIIGEGLLTDNQISLQLYVQLLPWQKPILNSRTNSSFCFRLFLSWLVNCTTSYSDWVQTGYTCKQIIIDLLHLKQKAMKCLTYKQCFGQFWLFKARKQLDHLQKGFFGKDSLGQMVLTLSNPWILLLYFRSLLPRERWMHLVPWRKPLTLFQSRLLPFSCDTCRRWLQSQLRRIPLSCSLFLLTFWAGFCQTKRAEVLETYSQTDTLYYTHASVDHLICRFCPPNIFVQYYCYYYKQEILLWKKILIPWYTALGLNSFP